MGKPTWMVIWADVDDNDEYCAQLVREETDDPEKMAGLVNGHPGCLVIRDAVVCEVVLEHKVIPHQIQETDPAQRAANAGKKRR